MPKANKADQVEKNKRVRAVQEWLLLGYAVGDIIMQVVAKWNISERQAHRYVAEAYTAFKEESKNKASYRKAFHLAARQKLYNKALETDPALALRVLQDMGKLEGLYVHKVDHTSKGEKLENTNAVIKLSDGTTLSLD